MNLERAMRMALDAHEGQTDKAGEPYVYHPFRVMGAMQNNEARIVAVLHDLVEDTDIKLDVLKEEGFSEEIITYIDVLSRRKDESYFDYIQRIIDFDLQNRNGHIYSIPYQVKMADLDDNMDLSRLPEVTDKDIERQRKYIKARRMLTESTWEE